MRRPVLLAAAATAALAALTAGLAAQRDLALWPPDPLPALAALPVCDAVADGHLVTVVDDAGHPVAGADVHVVARGAVDAATWAFLQGHHGTGSGVAGPEVGVVASRFGARYRAGADGTVTVAMPADGLVYGVAGAAVAVGLPVAGRTRVALVAQRSVRVEVVDADGRPVPFLSLHVGFEPLCYGLGAGVTGPTGRAELRVPAKYAPADARHIRVQAAVVGARRVLAPLPADYFAPERPPLLRLQLPPSGAVLVSVGGRGAVTLSGPEQEVHGGPRWQAWWPLRHDERGAWFPAVEVGGEVTARVIVDGDRASESAAAQPITVTGRGPTAVGETVTMAVPLAGHTLTLEGRALDEAGAPLADRPLWLWIGTAKGRVFAVPRTDAEGVFRVTADPAEFRGARLRIEVRRAAPDPAEPPAAAVAFLPADRRGTVALGDLRLAPEPVLITGKVVDADGNALAGLRVEAPRTLNAEITGFPGHAAITDAEGRFTFYEAEPENKAIPLRVVADGWRLLDPVSAAPGADDVVVRVGRLANLELHFADPDLADHLTIEVRPAGAVRGTFAPGLRGGQVRISSLFAGRYDVQVLLAGRVVTTLRDIEVKAGGEERATRVEVDDWSRLVAIAKVRLVDGDGRPVSAQVCVISPDGSRSGPARPDDAGRTDLPFLVGQSVVAMHPDFRTVQSLPGPDPVDLVLVPRARLRLRLPAGIALPTGVRVECSGDVAGEPNNGLDWRDGEENVLRPPGSGETALWLGVRDAQGRRVRLLRQVVDLPADDALTDVVLEVDADTAARAAELVEAARQRGK